MYEVLIKIIHIIIEAIRGVFRYEPWIHWLSRSSKFFRKKTKGANIELLGENKKNEKTKKESIRKKDLQWL